MSDIIKYCHTVSISNQSFKFDHVHIKWDKQIHLHRQDFWEIAYIITGGGTRIVGDNVAPFSEGEVILIPPHIPHCWSFDEFTHDDEGKIENICLFFSTDLLIQLKTTFPELTEQITSINKISNGIEFKEHALVKLQDTLRLMLKQNPSERVLSFLSILSAIANTRNTNIVGQPIAEGRNTKKMQILELYVMNNFQNNISLNDVSKFMGMEKSSFCVFFKRNKNVTFFQYLTAYRITSSCKLLINSDLTISEIAYSCGFRDIPYFNRMFKKIKGMTPSKYRESKRHTPPLVGGQTKEVETSTEK
ncbi:AraC family transcriptional regulator [Fulvivirga ulvae]|uniref:AraC family transcriptional regulator n=1 Tax=Fulvivirga ulvae TaxID=2904245 RepID=UPI001F3C9095|nr:AraC family transcriptional regulator [Fulvivirga ulvae]UII32851.1 AraC family transcriptional regulator [Fulvivirga ulvae]